MDRKFNTYGKPVSIDRSTDSRVSWVKKSKQSRKFQFFD